jgi:hypothetical protein
LRKRVEPRPVKAFIAKFLSSELCPASLRKYLKDNDAERCIEVLDANTTITDQMKEALLACFDILLLEKVNEKLLVLGSYLGAGVLEDLLAAFEIELSHSFHDQTDGVRGLPRPLVWYRFSVPRIDEQGLVIVELKSPGSSRWRSSKSTSSSKAFDLFIKAMQKDGYAGNKNRSALIAEDRLDSMILRLDRLLKRLAKQSDEFNGSRNVHSKIDYLVQSLGLSSKRYKLLAELLNWRLSLDEPFSPKESSQTRRMRFTSRQIRDRLTHSKR